MQKRILLATLLPLIYGGQAVALDSAPLSAPETQPAYAPEQVSDETLDTLIAPIALYPDSVMTHILIASTYPLQVIEAHRWRQANQDLSEEQLEAALAAFDWEPSVKALVPFTDVLRHMSDDLTWLQTLGDAVITNEQRVLDRVQALRLQAHKSGNLHSNEYQQVTTQERIIVIEPRRPEVIYVPYYDPHYVYGHWHHRRQPVFWPASVRISLGHRIHWGPHVSLSASFYFGQIWWPERHIIVRHTPIHHYTRPSYHKRYSVTEYHRWHHNAGKRHARYSKTVERYNPAMIKQHRTQNKSIAHRKLYTATQALSARGTSHKPVKANTHPTRNVISTQPRKLKVSKPGQHTLAKPNSHTFKQPTSKVHAPKRDNTPAYQRPSQPRNMHKSEHSQSSRITGHTPKQDTRREIKQSSVKRSVSQPHSRTNRPEHKVTKSKQRSVRQH